jgi:hypothetical protein
MRRAWRWHGLGATLALAMSLHTPVAHAYVRAVNEAGMPLWWKVPCITMEMHIDPAPPDMTADQYFEAGVLAGRAWSYTTVACTGMSLSMARATGSTSDTGLDGINMIVFRQDSWCAHPASGQPTTSTCYPSNALAITTVFKSKTTGEIVDADMELNGVNFAWADLVAHPELAKSGTADFQNTLTHELGHVLGFAHPCYTPTDGSARLADNNGQPELDCTDSHLPSTILATTMFPSVDLSDTARRTLSPDDQQAVCDVYPASGSLCTTFPSHGCAVATSAPSIDSRIPSLLAIGALALALFVFFRRVRIMARVHPTKARAIKLKSRGW